MASWPRSLASNPLLRGSQDLYLCMRESETKKEQNKKEREKEHKKKSWGPSLCLLHLQHMSKACSGVTHIAWSLINLEGIGKYWPS